MKEIELKTDDLTETVTNALRKHKVLDGWDASVNVRYDNWDKTVRVTIAQMYEYVKINYSTFQALSEVLGTTNIDIEGQELASSGCDTCDYGSSYEVTLVAKDVKV